MKKWILVSSLLTVIIFKRNLKFCCFKNNTISYNTNITKICRVTTWNIKADTVWKQHIFKEEVNVL